MHLELACLLLEVSHFDFDLNCLCFLDTFGVLVERRFSLSKPIQYPQKDCVLVLVLMYVFFELLCQLSLDTFFLTLQKTLEQHLDCKVNVIRANVVSEVDFSFCLTHS